MVTSNKIRIKEWSVHILICDWYEKFVIYIRPNLPIKPHNLLGHHRQDVPALSSSCCGSGHPKWLHCEWRGCWHCRLPMAGKKNVMNSQLILHQYDFK